MNTRDTGQALETHACAHLQAAGLTLLAKNVSYRFGELDLIMRDGGQLVFVEVRYRRQSHFGGGLLSVTAAKRRRIAQAASAWLMENPREARRACRFDVVALGGDVSAPDLNWVKNAFTLEDI